MNLEYSEALDEVLQVLKYTEKALIDKIPKKLIEFFERNAKTKSELNIDSNIKIEEINLKPKSKSLLGMIYRNYWCDSDERKKYDEILMQNEEKIQLKAREIYNPEKIFEDVKKQNIESEENNESSIIVYKKNIFIIVANIIPISPIKNIVENLDKSVFVV